MFNVCYTTYTVRQTDNGGKLKANTPRQKAIHKAIKDLIPLAPYSDFMPIAEAARARHMRNLTPVNGVFLATVAYIRHVYTEYDALRDEGYDHDSARYFVVDAIDQKLQEWGATRSVTEAVDDAPSNAHQD